MRGGRPLIDLHCHIDLYPDPKNLIFECKKRDIYVLSVTTTPKAWRGTVTLLKDCPQIKPALGLHPQLAHQRSQELPLFEELINETKYIGEIGLDGSKKFRSHIDVQIKVFRRILKICALSGGRILSIHSLGAANDALDVLEAYPNSGKPILHWFSGNYQELKRAIDIGCWFSVGPAMLRSKKGKEITSRIPRDKILTESDGPFAKLNKQPLTPMDMPKAIEILAQLWGEPIMVVNERLLSSFRNLLAD
jgi:TatD DNase family protein